LAALRFGKRDSGFAGIIRGTDESRGDPLSWSSIDGTHTVGLLDAVAILEECERSVGLEDLS
jgi:hypothetical protein